MDLGVKGNVFALVGGSTGMGYATAKILCEEGATCVLIARNKARADEKAAELNNVRKGAALAIEADGTKSDSLKRAIDQVEQQFGRLDGLAVTAGPMLEQTPFEGVTDQVWSEYFETQLMMTVRACRAALPHLIKSKGSIVTTSAYSIRAQKPVLSAYTAMKSAIASTTKGIAKAYGAQGVRANCVCPGAIATEALDEAKALAVKEYGEPADEALDRFMIKEWGLKIALERVGRPHEVGELMAFLLSEKAVYMTGALINIDGGTDF